MNHPNRLTATKIHDPELALSHYSICIILCELSTFLDVIDWQEEQLI